MEYEQKIINLLMDIYERRGTHRKELSEIRQISIKIADVFPEYKNQYNHEVYKSINLSVESLVRLGLVESSATERGIYKTVRLCPEKAEAAYAYIGRIPIDTKFASLQTALEGFRDTGLIILDQIVSDFQEKVDEGKKIPYKIEYDADRLKSVLTAIKAILQLPGETYTRNFSNALFRDSKVFQRDFRSTVQSILYDYTEASVEKERILEVYNLYDNPTYVLMKGNAVILSGKSCIYLHELTGGISFPEKALDDIREIHVLSSNVITVENLTTFHDCSDSDSLYIYLGGFHNHSKEILLKMIYRQNPDRSYFHKGDLDVYGFLILENMKKKTGIPFVPFEMDVSTLRKFYEAGLYKKLTSTDKKIMNTPALEKYKDVLRFMLEHDCKVEQESIKAIELMERPQLNKRGIQ